MTFPIELEGASLVLVGSFNPQIFQPAWFQHQGLLSGPDAEGAEIEVITRDLSVFTASGMRVIVQPQRFQVEVLSMDMLAPTRDLAIGTFKLLEHTPITSMGVNRHSHYRMASDDAWHTVGHKLAPKELWQGLLETPGTRSVQIQGKRVGSPSSYLRVIVEPSQKTQRGVYVGTNEHFAGNSLREHLDWLEAEWETAQQFARSLGPEILTRCLDAAS